METATVGDEPGAAALTPAQRDAAELLTRAPGEAYDLYVLRIAFAPGPAGRLARAVKLADLDDHLNDTEVPESAPLYRWARRHIARAEELQRREEPPAPIPSPPSLTRGSPAPQLHTDRGGIAGALA